MGLRDRALLETLYETGLRRSECHWLDVEDFDPGQSILTVRRGKGGVARRQPVGPHLVGSLRRYLAEARARRKSSSGSALAFLVQTLPDTMGLALYPTMWDNHAVRYAFVEAGNFSRSRDHYFRTDSDFAAFQVFLLRNPLAGAVIPGAGGLRKVRWGGERTGKSGGLRIIYLHMPELRHIYLLDVYSKGEQVDLSPEDRRMLAALAHDYQVSLQKPTS